MIPESLKELNRWVVWRNDTIPGGRTTKVPYDARTMRRAKSNDPNTWATYADAQAAAQGDSTMAGVGIMLGDLGDGRTLCGVDLDDCIVGGAVVEKAAEIIRSIPTYWETSPGGFGVKGFGYGKKPDGSRAVCQVDGFGQIEVYDSGRWFAVTGQDISSLPVADVQQPLVSLLEEYGLTTAQKSEPARPILVRYSDPVDAVARASAYLATVDPAIEGANGHGALFRAACVLVNGFALDRSTAIQLLSAEYNPRCSPPWNLGNTSEKREFERKVDQAMKASHDHPRGHLLDAGHEPFDATSVIGIDFDAIARNGRKVSNITHKADYCSQPDTYDTLETSKQIPIPAHLLEPPGLLGKVVGWINATASGPQPELALANAIPFIGAILGKKVRTPNNARTNFYTLGVGASCCGKDHSRIQTKQLVRYSGIDAIMGGEDVTSGQAIMRVAGSDTGKLLQLDEIGHFFSNVTSGTAATHEKSVIPTLTKIFTSAGTTMFGKEFADSESKPRIDLVEPCLCMYGTATPHQLFSSFSASQVQDGFLGRLLIFVSQDASPKWRDIEDRTPPKSLCEQVARWGRFKPDAPEGMGNIAAATYGAQIVPYTDEAKTILDAFRDRTQDLRVEMIKREGEHSLHPLWGRAAEQAEKLSLVASMDEPTDTLRIGGCAMRWATELVAALVSGLVEVAAEEVSENGHDRVVGQIIATIRQAGAAGVARATISRKFRKVKARDRDDILTDLARDGVIHKTTRSEGRGRPSEWYTYSG